MSTENAKNILTVPENPAPVEIETPKVTATHDLTIPAENSVSVPSISFDTLLTMGIVEKNRAGKYNASSAVKSARDYLKDANPTLAAKIDSDSLAVLLASVGQNTAAVVKAGKRVALAMALVDLNATYKQYGFKNASSMFHALYPTLADSTIWNYINTGKTIYIPAKTKNAPEYLKDLAELEPGTALFAVGVLRDEKASKRFPALLKKAMKEHGGKLTQSALKAAAKEARNAETKKKENGTTGTEKKDEKAKDNVSKQAKRDTLEKGLRAWIQRGIHNGENEETPFTISDDCKKEGRTYLQNAIKNGDANLVLEIMIDFFMK